MSADALIGFDRHLHVRYLGQERFELWLRHARDDVRHRVTFAGSAFAQLVNDRCTVVSEPIRLSRDGRDVVISVRSEAGEWGRIGAESFRDLVHRSIRVA